MTKVKNKVKLLTILLLAFFTQISTGIAEVITEVSDIKLPEADEKSLAEQTEYCQGLFEKFINTLKKGYDTLSDSEKQIVYETVYAIPFCRTALLNSKNIKKYDEPKNLPENKLSILIPVGYSKTPMNIFYIIDDLSDTCRNVPLSEKIKCIIHKDPYIINYYIYFLPMDIAMFLKVKYKDQIELLSFYKRYNKACLKNEMEKLVEKDLQKELVQATDKPACIIVGQSPTYCYHYTGTPPVDCLISCPALHLEKDFFLASKIDNLLELKEAKEKFQEIEKNNRVTRKFYRNYLISFYKITSSKNIKDYTEIHDISARYIFNFCREIFNWFSHEFESRDLLK